MHQDLKRHIIRLVLPGILCIAPPVGAQNDAPQALRTAPVEKLTTNAGVRDWGPSTLAGATLVAGGPSGSGGLFAVDTTSGKLRWTYRPGKHNGSVSTPPALTDKLAIAPFGAANPGLVVGVSLSTGKEVWRGPDPAVDAAVTVHGELAFILSKDGNFYALDAATGREVWRAVFSNKRHQCASRPIVRDGVIYFTTAAEGIHPKGAREIEPYLVALDAQTGQERWRYRAAVPDEYKATCLRQPVATGDTIYAAGDNRLYAIHRATGLERWPSAEVRRMIDGRNRLVPVHGLLDAGDLLVGMTSVALLGFDKNSGQIAWELPGTFNTTSPAMALASDVLYFQGSLAASPAASHSGTLHALELMSRRILWSFSRPTAEPNWPFGHVTPVNGGLWVDSYAAMVKLQ